jgi:hypothetical protein
MRGLIAQASVSTDWPEGSERLLDTAYAPQLVRHVQPLSGAMRRAGTLG